MRKLSNGLCALLALTFATASAAPGTAAPMYTPKAPVASGDVDQVQYRRIPRNRVERRGGRVFYNGQRGYVERRPGYRRYNGFWFPAAAFIAGAIVGGALNDQPRMRSGSAHMRWCENRWRSYRAYDNTYQPSYGSRRECISPYS